MSNNSIDFIKNTFLNLIENFESIFSSFDQVATLYHFIILALLILFSGFFSAAEIAIFHVKEYQIQDEKGKLLKKKYRFLYKLVARKEIAFCCSKLVIWFLKKCCFSESIFSFTVVFSLRIR